MSDDAIRLYRRFLSGRSGTCIFTGKDGCHAFVTEGEIEATAGSRHDLHHFVWLDHKPGEIGPHGISFVSDDHIDVLLAKRRIALIYSERDGPVATQHEALKAAFLLGAARMGRVLVLPVDEQKRVLPETVDTLPLSLRVLIERLALPAPIPLARLVEKIIPLAAAVEDAEARGRIFVLARVAVGANLAGVEEEAEHCAAWIVDRVGRQAAADDIIGPMLDRIATDRGKLQ